jgi:hypothetical protein
LGAVSSPSNFCASNISWIMSQLKPQFFPKDLQYLSYVQVWLPEDGAGRGAPEVGGAPGGGLGGAARGRRCAGRGRSRGATRAGGDLEVRETGEGWRLQGYGCPLSAVTGRRPEVCALAQALVEEITGRPVADCCDRDGRPRCGFMVSR